MEIWLLLTVAGMVSSTHRTISVDEEGKTEVIYEGSSVTLNCSVETNCSKHCRFKWLFNKNGSSITSSKDIPNETLKELTRPSFSLNYSGWYFCHVTVEIPILKKKSSNWTELQVSTELLENSSQTGVTSQVPEPPFLLKSWWVWIVVGLSGLILVIACLLLRWKRVRRRDPECPIYANTHQAKGTKQPSPKPKSANNSTLKMDSSYQNLRTPDLRYEHSKRL